MALKTLTILLMDPPYETENTTTALRIADAVLRKGHKVRIFAYEGAVSLTMSQQKQHPNPVKNQDVAQADHPTTIRTIQSLFKKGPMEWIACGMCVDERGVDFIPEAKRGGPKDFYEWVKDSTNTLVIGTQ